MNQQHKTLLYGISNSFSTGKLRHFTIFAFLLVSLQSAAQYTLTYPQPEHRNIFIASQFSSLSFDLTKEALLKKSKNQKTAAWTILGAGAVVIIAGVISYPDEGVTWLYSNAANRKKADRATIVTLTGTGLSLASIPFFVAAKKNKKRANLIISSQKTSMALPPGFAREAGGITAVFSIGK